MDDRARAILNKARETLARIADIKVEHRVHDDDGFLSPWSRTMPTRPRPPTIDEVRQIVRDEIAGQPRAMEPAAIEALVERVLRENSVVTPNAIAPILHELRQQLRAEIRSAVGERQAEEFFYLDDAGNKQDADLHNPILRAVDYPIDEKIMAPIRARNRAKHVAEREAKRARSARVIDLPNPLALRGRHG
ncbi:hypothetical protein [Bradyrhizobium sp. CSS354]|uniref:hypothetical protein n=1 Tax=Bradyrhizobium sp. CSS354 TaxID=2699172 RepID=UPI0023AED177|nr:hypothetical protein [Bradyrhizobium sp. CSS354]MDE5461156.1 hypothetical protein [Bradyrhizobium sp. CSS354]